MLNPQRLAVLVTVLLAAAGGAVRADGLDALGGLLAGRVASASSPLASSNVYVYQLSDFTLRKVVTDDDGAFLFHRLPAGIYKVIAYKSGFVPAIALLSRATEQARQFLDFELLAETAFERAGEDSYWSIRQQIPADVLRDIEGTEAEEAAALEEDRSQRLASLVRAEMQAVAGTSEGLDYGSAMMAGGRLGLRGAIQDVSIGLTGDFRELEAGTSGAVGASTSLGHSQAVSLQVDHGGSTGVQLTSLNNRLRPTEANAVDFERHRVSWSQAVGESGRSDFLAQYTAESNFYRQGAFAPLGLPAASRSWRVEGSYTSTPSERSTVQAGVRYRERESEYLRSDLPVEELLPEERMDLYGRGGLQVKPAVLVEFGLYSTLRDGSLSLAPRSGFVLQLAPNWRAYTAASYQIHDRRIDELEHRPDFMAAHYNELNTCELTDEYCYRVLLAREVGGQETFSIGAVHRRLAETLRLYFNDDFFNHLESLYLVEGDSLPEVQLALTRRLAPKVLARLESSLAAGGGGVLYATDDSSYENRIRYLVTSLDTRFEQTSTGVFVAFHHLAQELEPLDRQEETPDMELERLQLMLTQDLDVLSRVTTDLALHLNMEVSRGASSVTGRTAHDTEDLRKRVTGGIAVRF